MTTRSKKKPEPLPGGVNVSADTTMRKTVTLRRSTVARVEARTGSRDFSAYVDGAVARQLAMDDIQDALDEATTRLGPISDEAMAEAEQAWGESERWRSE
ncbi:hypothetical protein ACIBO5_27430 [Nonomuraea angiospora]|uniref:hypothetical protein n=1 Tax=Nonomuraea angiospora TaxID=46172 RepID=UPI0029B0AF52|nr:hypothetical protein [Nonomuraea angiospora]MDX3105084.1 hypothetical protein [Nonomuraea angiospora]